jgi:hypothetical protein
LQQNCFQAKRWRTRPKRPLHLSHRRLLALFDAVKGIYATLAMAWPLRLIIGGFIENKHCPIGTPSGSSDSTLFVMATTMSYSRSLRPPAEVLDLPHRRPAHSRCLLGTVPLVCGSRAFRLPHLLHRRRFTKAAIGVPGAIARRGSAAPVSTPTCRQLSHSTVTAGSARNGRSDMPEKIGRE